MAVGLLVGAALTTASCAGASEGKIGGAPVAVRGGFSLPPELDAFVKVGNGEFESRVLWRDLILDLDIRVADLNGQELINTYPREGIG